MKSLSVLKIKNFRYYFTADIISMFGTGMSFIGSNWFILKYTGLSTSVGMLMSLSFLGGLIIFPISGTLVDKFKRLKIIYWSNLIRGVLTAIVAFTIFTGNFQPWQLYILAMITGAGWTIFIPASRGLIQELLETKDLMHGNSLVEVSMQIGMFISGAAAGIFYKYFGFGTILIIDAITFFLSNIFISLIKHEAHIAHDVSAKFTQRFKNGFNYLIQNKNIFAFGTAVYLPIVVILSSNVLAPAYVSNFLQRDSIVFGFSDMSYGIGACIAGLIASLIVEKFSRKATLIYFFLASILVLIFLLINRNVPLYYLSMLIFGLSCSSLRIILNTVVMEVVPKSYIGRAMAVWMAISTIMQISSAYGLGWFIDIVPPQYGNLWLAAIMIAGFISCTLLLKKVQIKCQAPVNNLDNLHKRPD